ncbi:hypothetical protein [Paraburkholderia rhizosphaerae]|uniref:DUF1579 domain-containing protein n=1 Tax=Paraburkholderia rhizosphaerae TaxID=480658 RepID=A0A4R8L5W6_9BURK|nr:hypothetical protein [Paraburkholderia rhizosphaerae]TDY37725.1 hypothetical protein BX592_13635 [Paraburkholderia rhizosphaerae]
MNAHGLHEPLLDAHPLLTALSAPSRAADIDEADDVYGWLVGSWRMQVLHYRDDLRAAPLQGEIQFGWVLEGRAVQDVWIMPPREQRTGAHAAAHDMYGTTLRVWDPAVRAWRVTYLNPATGQRDELIGRRIGNAIVQIGTHANGTPIRWNFTDIGRDSFHWTGVALAPDGITWVLEAEFAAQRVRG